MSQVTGTNLLNAGGSDEMSLSAFHDTYEFNYLAIRVCFFRMCCLERADQLDQFSHLSLR